YRTETPAVARSPVVWRSRARRGAGSWRRRATRPYPADPACRAPRGRPTSGGRAASSPGLRPAPSRTSHDRRYRPGRLPPRRGCRCRAARPRRPPRYRCPGRTRRESAGPVRPRSSLRPATPGAHRRTRAPTAHRAPRGTMTVARSWCDRVFVAPRLACWGPEREAEPRERSQIPERALCGQIVAKRRLGLDPQRQRLIVDRQEDPLPRHAQLDPLAQPLGRAVVEEEQRRVLREPLEIVQTCVVEPEADVDPGVGSHPGAAVLPGEPRPQHAHPRPATEPAPVVQIVGLVHGPV